MKLDELNLVLADIKTALVERRCEHLEAAIDEYDDDEDDDDLDEASLASDGTKISKQQAGGGSGGPEAYTGYTVGNEGDRKLDGGGTKSASSERMQTLRASLHGGPGDMPPQTTAGQAAHAKKYSRKDRENMGDVNNSGHYSGA